MIAPDTQAQDAPEGSEATPVSPDPGNAPQDAPQPVCVPDWPPSPNVERCAELMASTPKREQERRGPAGADEIEDLVCLPPRRPLPRPGPALLAEAARVLNQGHDDKPAQPPAAPGPDQEAQELAALRPLLARSGYGLYRVRTGYMVFWFGGRTVFTDIDALRSWIVREGLL